MNPTQQVIASGVNPIVAFLSAQTCGDACWHAREDVCHCSCGGKNHGCLRSASGEQPVRTARIMGTMHTLVAVGTQGQMHHEAVPINQAAGITYLYADSARDFSAGPAKIRKATEAQIAKWPELASMRNWRDGHEPWDAWHYAPYLLWVEVSA